MLLGDDRPLELGDGDGCTAECTVIEGRVKHGSASSESIFLKQVFHLTLSLCHVYNTSWSLTLLWILGLRAPVKLCLLKGLQGVWSRGPGEGWPKCVQGPGSARRHSSSGAAGEAPGWHGQPLLTEQTSACWHHAVPRGLC